MGLTGGVGAAFAVAMSLLVPNWEQERIRHHIEQQAFQRAAAIDRSIDASVDVPQSIQSLCDTSPRADRRQFATFVRGMIAHHPSIQALEWFPRVPDAKRAAFEAAAREDGHPSFQFTERKTQRQMGPAGRRPEYFPVYYVEHSHGSEIALGFDLASDPKRRAALEQARDMGEPTATSQIILVQEAAHQIGFLMFASLVAHVGCGPGRSSVAMASGGWEGCAGGASRRTMTPAQRPLTGMRKVVDKVVFKVVQCAAWADVRGASGEGRRGC